jgi:hypothetical protein
LRLFAIAGAPDPVLKVFGIVEAIHDLPFENKHMIREICTFLKDVQDNFAKTKMDLKNIAIAFGPSFFPGAKGAIFDFKTIGLFCEVVTILVTNLEDIFADMELEMETKPNGKDADSFRSTNSGKSTPPFSCPTTPPDDDGQTRGSASSSPSVTSTRGPSHGHITVGSRIQRQSSSTTHDDYESELEAPAVEAN